MRSRITTTRSPTGVWREEGQLDRLSREANGSRRSNTRCSIDEFIVNNVKILDKNDPKGKVGVLRRRVGHLVRPGAGPRTGLPLSAEHAARRAGGGLNFNIFHRHAKRVQMTNIAQMVNVLQAMILTDGPKMALTPTYHVFQMYIPFQGATFLPTEITTPDYKLGDVHRAVGECLGGARYRRPAAARAGEPRSAPRSRGHDHVDGRQGERCAWAAC